MASIPDQTATAFAGDIGLSTYLVPHSHGDCMPAQRDCMAAPVGDDPAEHVEVPRKLFDLVRSEEHTSELQSLMRISYAVFCLKKKKNNKSNTLDISKTIHRLY